MPLVVSIGKEMVVGKNGFASRMIWATTHSYELANHLPNASLDVLKMIKVVPQQKVPLFGHATDPDGDALDI